jgi:hypothetical protein
MTEIGSQELWESEDELPVRQGQQEPVLHVLREQEGSFLGAGRAEIEPLTGEWPEVFELAVGIGALDTGDTLGIVAAEDELFYYFRDSLDAEAAVDAGKLRFILASEALKMFLEQKLDGVDPSRLIDYLPDRGKLKGELSFHIDI